MSGARPAPAILVIVAPDRPRHPRAWSMRIAAEGAVDAMVRLARRAADRNPVEVTRHPETSDTGIEAQVFLMTRAAFEGEMARGAREIEVPIDPDYAPNGRAWASPWSAIRPHRIACFTAREIEVPTAGDVGWW